MSGNALKIIYQELAFVLSELGVDTRVPEIREAASTLEERLATYLVDHVPAAEMMGIHSDTLHSLRQRGRIQGIPKDPSAKRIHYQYRYTDIVRCCHEKGKTA